VLLLSFTASSRRTVLARKREALEQALRALRSDLTGELAENDPDPVSLLVIGERDTRLPSYGTPSTSTDDTPESTPCGFSTAMSYRAE